MLNEKELHLLRLLAESTAPLTSRALAAELGIPVRTVKTYVQRINREQDGAIVSSQQGYRADTEAVKSLLEQPHAPANRCKQMTSEPFSCSIGCSPPQSPSRYSICASSSM